MDKLKLQVGALDERIDGLISSLENERIDAKTLKDLVFDVVGFDLQGRSANRFRTDWRGKASILTTVQRPSRGTLYPDLSLSKDFVAARHVAVQGENLEVLKIIERAYFGKIKMIYMNPPFNIGGELIFDDKGDVLGRYDDYINNKEPIEKIGISAGSGHSEWMSAIYARLFVLRNLLASDGVIFVSIDDHESHRLRAIMDEIFGEENFVASFVWEKRYSPPPDAQDVGYVHENIICYRRSEEFSAGLLPMTDDQSSRYTNQDGDPRGPWKAADYTCRYTADERPTLFYPVINPNTGQEVYPKRTRVWACSRIEHEKNSHEGRIWWGADGKNSIPAKKKYLFEIRQGAMPKTILQHDEVGHTDEATKELRVHLPDLKLSPKPTRLMRHLLNIANVKQTDFVLDCYAGTGALGEAIFEMEKAGDPAPAFVLIEFPEKLESQPLTLSDAMFARLKSSAERVGTAKTGFRAFKLGVSHFAEWEGRDNLGGDLIEILDKHVANLRNGDDAIGLFFEVLIRSGFPLSTPYSVISIAGKSAFAVAGGSFIICVERQITIDLIEAIAEMDPVQVVLLDDGFKNNDELKANAVQTFRARSQAEESEIVFRTI